MRLPERLQDLPVAAVQLCLAVERFITHIIPREIINLSGRTLLIACSGGLDSTALLAVLHFLAPRLKFQIVVSHLNHGLRSEASVEAAAVHNLCTANNFPYHTEIIQTAAYAVDRRIGLEEAGRELRHAYFQRLLSAGLADFVALGHQLNDLAEDQLLRQIRGTGWPSLAGMPAWDARRRFLRPILLISRQDLTAFCCSLGLSWNEDPSNKDTRFRRNRIRHYLMPLFLAENPRYLEAAANLWRLGQLDAAHFDAALPIDLASSAPCPSLLPTAWLDAVDDALALRGIKHQLVACGANQLRQINLIHLLAIWRHRNAPGRRSGRSKILQFPGRITAQLNHNGIIFSKDSRNNHSKMINYTCQNPRLLHTKKEFFPRPILASTGGNNMFLNERIISEAIVNAYFEKFKNCLDVDVAIAGGGPAGLTAGWHLASQGFKVALYERKLSIGGGMWGGGMTFNYIVVQEKSRHILDEAGIPLKHYRDGYYTCDAVLATTTLASKACLAGVQVFNCISVEDVVLREENNVKRVAGLVINSTPVMMAGLHIDPLVIHCRYVIEATGHDVEVLKTLVRKNDIKLYTHSGNIEGEESMWAEVAESNTVYNTREVFPGIYVAGMAANASFGSYRMGPIFGGMLLSGEKVATKIASQLKGK
ncbi:Thiamine thiazole synthase / tRNA(Ile)-lysidine synthase [Desulfovibrionales bacterium]